MNWLKLNIKWVVYGLIAVVVLSLATTAYVTLKRFYGDYINVSNKLADADSLKVIYRTQTGIMAERYARQEQNLNDVAKQNDLLARYIKDTKGTVQMLVTKMEEVSLQNQQLAGLIKKDSSGRTYGQFDTTTKDYQLSARAYLEPKPLLFIDRLTIKDTSNIMISKIDSGYVTGTITHTNPLVTDNNAIFRTKAPKMELPSAPINIILSIGLVTVGLIAGLLL